MKLSRRFRSFGAAFVCAAVFLCNLPLVQAQNATIIVDGYILKSVSGNGTGELESRDGNRIPGTIGGTPHNGNANNNTVIVINGIVSEGVYGSHLESGYVISNSVTVTGNTPGATVNNVYGGHVDLGLAIGNEVLIENNSRVQGEVVGGYAGALTTDTTLGTTSYNTVTVKSGANILGDIYGGRSGSSLSNVVNIEGGIITGDRIVGGGSYNTDALEAYYNEVNISGNAEITGNVYGGLITIADAIENTVNITSGKIGGNIYGGVTGLGNSEGNIVTIGGNAVIGGNEIIGGVSNQGNATDNKVILRGSIFNGVIIGGASTTGKATGNIVDIYPGFSAGTNTRIFGGLSDSGNDARSGNTLKIRGPVTIRGLSNFENYNFFLPADLKANQTMLTVTGGNGGSGGDGSIDLNDAKIEIGVLEGSALKKGDTVILIDEQGGFGFNGAPANNVSDGSTLDVEDSSGLVHYRFGLSMTENQLRAEVAGASLDQRTDSIPEGFLGGLILANQGADAIAGAAMDSAMTAAHKGPVAGIGGFGSLVVGKSKYETGSDVDMLGLSAAAGVAFGFDFTNSILTMGPFLEYGRADFDTVNTLSDEQKIAGDGESDYMGGGFLLRVDFRDTGAGRYFAEASARAGRQKNNFSINWPGQETFSYESTAPYYGLHLGYGGSWDVASSAALDIYGKYFLARGGDSSVTTSGGEEIDFDAVTSNRIRGGARLTFTPGERLTLGIGGAYDYEMNGEIKAILLSHAINAPSIKGGTGIGEVVFGYKPSADRLTSINIGVQGYSGKRQGVTASLFVRF